MPRKTKFSEAWLSTPEFSTWISKASSESLAKCRLCSKEFDISNMGESA